MKSDGETRSVKITAIESDEENKEEVFMSPRFLEYGAVEINSLIKISPPSSCYFMREILCDN